jgi:hypothetical protein
MNCAQVYEHFEFFGCPWDMPMALFDACIEAINDRELERAAASSPMAQAILDQQRKMRRKRR